MNEKIMHTLKIVGVLCVLILITYVQALGNKKHQNEIKKGLPEKETPLMPLVAPPTAKIMPVTNGPPPPKHLDKKCE